MTNEIYEIVKEFRAVVDGTTFEVKGKIFKRLPQNNSNEICFKWDVSHHYKEEITAKNVLVPKNTFADTYESAETQLINYIQSFTPIGVERNHNFV